MSQPMRRHDQAPLREGQRSGGTAAFCLTTGLLGVLLALPISTTADSRSASQEGGRAWKDPVSEPSAAIEPPVISEPPHPSPVEGSANDAKPASSAEVTQPGTSSGAEDQTGALNARASAPSLEKPLPQPVPPPLSETQTTRDSVDLPRLLAKAEELVRHRDISGARLVLERAVAAGSAEAAFLLAQTFDLRFLQSWKVRGIQPDPDKARELYGRAYDAGLIKAKNMAEAVQ